MVQKTFRHISLVLILIAQLIVTVHNTVPHHHHDGHEHHHMECCCHEHMADMDLHICSSHSCSQCTLLTDLLDSHSESFGQTILNPIQVKYFSDPNTGKSYEYISCIGHILKSIYHSSGLRAPPYYL